MRAQPAPCAQIAAEARADPQLLRPRREREEHYRRLEEHHLEQSKAHYRTMAAEARRREEAGVVIQRAWRRFWSWRSVVARER